MQRMLLELPAHPPVVYQVALYVVLAPMFGYGCAVSAGARGRRKWLWFVLGTLGTVITSVVLAYLVLKDRPAPAGKVN